MEQPPTDPWGNPLPPAPPAPSLPPAPPGVRPTASGSWWGDGTEAAPAATDPWGVAAPPAPTKTPGAAIGGLIASLVGIVVCGVVLCPVGVALGFAARSTIRRTGAPGDGLAIAAIVVGVVGFILNVVMIIALFTNPNLMDQLNDTSV